MLSIRVVRKFIMVVRKWRQLKNILEKQVATIQRQKTKRGSSKMVFIIGHPRLWMVESLWAFWSIYM